MRAALILILVAGLALPAILGVAQESGEVEARRPSHSCESCHRGPATGDQYGIWKDSAHSRSYEALQSEAALAVAKVAGVEGEPVEAAMCLSCHAPMEGRERLGVHCEVCHGDGDQYRMVCGESFAKTVEHGMHLSGERQCVTCHRASEAHPNHEFLYVLDAEDVAHPLPEKKGVEALFSTKGLYTQWEVFTEEDGLPHHIVFGVTPHGDEVWFATEDGVAGLKDGEMTAWHEEDGLPHQAVTQVAVDPESGEVWASTLCGIASFDGEKWTAYKQEEGLINNCAFGITLHGDDVWVATFDGISRLDRKSGKWTDYYLNNAPLEEVWIYGVEADHEKINFAVWGGGLVEYFPEEDHWQAHHDPDGSFEMDLIQNDGVISQMTTSVSRDNGWTWLASYFGMCAYDGRDWIEMDMDNSGLMSNFINFAKARRSEGWFATDRGITCFDMKRDRWVEYARREGPGGYGRITIRSRDGKRSRSITSETSIPYNFVWGIAFQGEDIWVATSDGVARGRY